MFKLIPDAKIAWRFASVQAAALLAVLSAIQMELLPIVQPLVPPEHWPYVTASLSLLIIVSRVISQPELDTERAQLGLDTAEASPAGKLSDEDEEVEQMAAMLYEAGGLSKPWEQVSAESRHKWRLVARAALHRPATARQEKA